jgi:hypothetical protein
LVTHACLPPTGQIEFEANSITTFTTVKKITRTAKTENMSDFDNILAKIKGPPPDDDDGNASYS